MITDGTLAVARARLGIATRNGRDVAKARSTYVALKMERLLQDAMDEGHLTDDARYRLGEVLELPVMVSPKPGETWTISDPRPNSRKFIVELVDDGLVHVKYLGARNRRGEIDEGDFLVGKYQRA